MYIPALIPERDRKMFEKGNMGRRCGFGQRLAVIVVDMTRGFVEDEFPLGCGATGQPAVRAIRQLLDATRPLGIPTFYTTSAPGTDAEWGRWLDKGTAADDSGLMRTPEAWAVAPLIAPEKGEVVLYKNKPSAFFGTQLVSLLTYHNADTVIVTGMVTSGCVRATVVDAFSYNFRVVVPIECVADRGQISHEVNLFDMDMKYADVMPLADVLKHLEEVAART